MNEQKDEVKADVKAGSSTTALSTKHTDADTGLSSLNLLDEKQLAAAEVFLKKIMASDKGGIKSINEGLAILMRAKDLQLPFSSCIEHIHVINGKTGIDIHIIKSLLSRAGVTWECTKDYAPQYEYTDGNTIYLETQLPDYCVKCRTAKEAEEKTTDDTIGVYPVRWYVDLRGTLYRENEVSDKCVKAINRQHALKLSSEKQFPVIRVAAQPVDFVTEYKFTRYKQILGEKVVVTATSHFSYKEACVAGFFDAEGGKDTYKKYGRIMIGIRAFTYGARDIASDVLMGNYETSELKLMTDTPISDEDYAEFADVEVVS